MINNTFRMRPLLAAVIIAAGFTVSLPALTPAAHAYDIVSDPLLLAKETIADLNRAVESNKELAYLKSQLEAIGVYAEMGIDNVNNGFANVIARLDKGEEERQNLEQMEKSQPATDACGTLTAASGLKDASCASEDKMNAFVAGRAKNNSMSTGGGKFVCASGATSASGCKFVAGEPPSVDNVSKKNTVDAIQTIDRCKVLLDTDGKSWCEHPELLMHGTALTDDQYEAVDIQISLASNLRKPVPYADDSIPVDTPEQKRAIAADLRRENMRESAVVGQKHLHMLMNGTRDKSGNLKGEVEVLETYMGERLGSENWMCEVTQACEAPYVPPAELEKRKIEMDAVLLHIALEQYKSSLRVEKYLTDMNLMQIESVTK